MAEKAPKLVNARWVGTFEGEMEDGTVLIPGETVVQIPEPEALESDHWQVAGSGSSGPTIKELRAEAKKRGIELPSGAKKAAIEKLLADPPAPEPEPEAPAEETAEETPAGDENESNQGSAD